MNRIVSLASLETAAQHVHAVLPATPQYSWPLLSARVGAKVWVKHENVLPVGAFKVRGGVFLMSQLKAAGVRGVIAATRGNHGQSIAFAARRLDMRAVIVVPKGNSEDKNRAMRGWGAELIEHGHDFQAALEHAEKIASVQKLHFVPSFSLELVQGVASYALEFFHGAGRLDSVYVPIGLGSGICGLIFARDALKLDTEIIGVVAEQAPCYALSFQAHKAISTEHADTLADGIACRIPNADALAIILKGAARIVTVSEAEIRAAMRYYFTDTHHVAEGAGAAPLAAALKERMALNKKRNRIGLILSGGNVDSALFASTLSECITGE